MRGHGLESDPKEQTCESQTHVQIYRLVVGADHGAVRVPRARNRFGSLARGRKPIVPSARRRLLVNVNSFSLTSAECYATVFTNSPNFRATSNASAFVAWQ